MGDEGWESVRVVLYNKMHRVHKTPREALFPMSNFTGHVTAYGLRKDSLLWVKEAGYHSQIDLDAYIGLKGGVLCPGGGFSTHPDFVSASLEVVDGYCRLVVMTAERTSHFDLDYFIGYVCYELCVSDLANGPVDAVCEYREKRGWWPF